MQKPKHHIFVCCSFRAAGEPKGVCHKKGAVQFIPYLETELSERGLSEVTVSATGCMKLCDNGPVMVIYPENYWYGKVESEDAIDEILDALAEGKAAEKYVIA